MNSMFPPDLPHLPVGWEWYLLSDLLEEERGISYGIVQPGRHDPDGIPILKVQNIFDGRIDTLGDLKLVSPEIANKYDRTLLRGGEIVLTLVGSIGQSAIVPHNLEGWNLARAVGLIPIHESIDARWIQYWLSAPLTQHYIHAWANTTVQATLNLGDVNRLPIAMPPEAERQQITELLASLDDKIKLNRQMNATLEATARAIFQSWFVDFDPVHAKANGEAPIGMDAATAALFPDAFVESELGPIPAGWEVHPIGEIVEAVGGGTPSTKEPDYWDGGHIPFTTPKDLSSLSNPVLLEAGRLITEAGLDTISSGLLPTGTVLLSSRAPVGYLAINEVPVAINQGYIAMKCNGPVSNYYVLWWTEANMDVIKQRASGTTFAEISKRNFRPIPALVPSEDVMTAFDAAVEPLYQAIVNNEHESRTLADLRDTLLPKLISGELRVGEGEV